MQRARSSVESDRANIRSNVRPDDTEDKHSVRSSYQKHLFSEHRINRFTVTGIQQLTVGDSKGFLERYPSALNLMGRRYQPPDSLRVGLPDMFRASTELVR
jgi:hypothetical protein